MDAASPYGSASYQQGALPPLLISPDAQLHPDDSPQYDDTSAPHAGRSPSDPYGDLAMVKQETAIQNSAYGQSTVYARARLRLMFFPIICVRRLVGAMRMWSNRPVDNRYQSALRL